ncbi:UNKNOWN [Stylonychia lemnae]|uniref:Uncharacterized protein n=1 Tax=Stylonychia lemnae TaxID=5949 RepID=A0A077ZR70_STYLE|nr:UNKNOWN [Stylonychia lemnae]|eukprot:CDW71835.1 UNKNOWN [Stylonychia lemnae]
MLLNEYDSVQSSKYDQQHNILLQNTSQIEKSHNVRASQLNSNDCIQEEYFKYPDLIQNDTDQQSRNQNINKIISGKSSQYYYLEEVFQTEEICGVHEPLPNQNFITEEDQNDDELCYEEINLDLQRNQIQELISDEDIDDSPSIQTPIKDMSLYKSINIQNFSEDKKSSIIEQEQALRPFPNTSPLNQIQQQSPLPTQINNLVVAEVDQDELQQMSKQSRLFVLQKMEIEEDSVNYTDEMQQETPSNDGPYYTVGTTERNYFSNRDGELMRVKSSLIGNVKESFKDTEPLQYDQRSENNYNHNAQDFAITMETQVQNLEESSQNQNRTDDEQQTEKINYDVISSSDKYYQISNQNNLMTQEENFNPQLEVNQNQDPPNDQHLEFLRIQQEFQQLSSQLEEHYQRDLQIINQVKNYEIFQTFAHQTSQNSDIDPQHSSNDVELPSLGSSKVHSMNESRNQKSKSPNKIVLQNEETQQDDQDQTEFQAADYNSVEKLIESRRDSLNNNNVSSNYILNLRISKNSSQVKHELIENEAKSNILSRDCSFSPVKDELNGNFKLQKIPSSSKVSTQYQTLQNIDLGQNTVECNQSKQQPSKAITQLRQKVVVLGDLQNLSKNLKPNKANKKPLNSQRTMDTNNKKKDNLISTTFDKKAQFLKSPRGQDPVISLKSPNKRLSDVKSPYKYQSVQQSANKTQLPKSLPIKEFQNTASKQDKRYSLLSAKKSPTRPQQMMPVITKTITEFPTHTLRRVYVDYDQKGKKFVENLTINKLRNSIFESKKQKENSITREMTQIMKFSSSLQLSQDQTKISLNYSRNNTDMMCTGNQSALTRLISGDKLRKIENLKTTSTFDQRKSHAPSVKINLAQTSTQCNQKSQQIVRDLIPNKQNNSTIQNQRTKHFYSSNVFQL